MKEDKEIFKKLRGYTDQIRKREIIKHYLNGAMTLWADSWRAHVNALLDELEHTRKQPPKARWGKSRTVFNDYLQPLHVCSRCRMCNETKTKFCPNCGAKMEE